MLRRKRSPKQLRPVSRMNRKAPEFRNPTTIAVRIAAVVSYSIAIIYLGTRHPSDLPTNEVFSHDKLLHAAAFGGLGLLVYRGICALAPARSRKLAIVSAIASATVLGGALEIIQARLPYRSMEFADLIADFVGAVVLVLAAARWSWERPVAGI